MQEGDGDRAPVPAGDVTLLVNGTDDAGNILRAVESPGAVEITF